MISEENRKQAIKLVSDCTDNLVKLTIIPDISAGQLSQLIDIIYHLNDLIESISDYKEMREDAEDYIQYADVW